MSRDGDWITFAKTVAGLWLLSYVGSFVDLLTLLYIGNLFGENHVSLLSYVFFISQTHTLFRVSKDFNPGLGINVAGVVLGMTVPVIYTKYEDKINRFCEWVRMQCRRFYDKIDEKVVKNVKNRVVKRKEETEEKKVE